MWLNLRRKASHPMTQISTYEAKSRFSEILSLVEQSGEAVVILRYGHPVARLMPMTKPSRLERDPVLSRVQVSGDLFDDTSADWEAMNGASALA